MDPVRVLVVGADPLARGGLVALLAREPLLAIAGETAPDRALRGSVQALAPAVAAWDTGPDDGFGESLGEAVEAGLPVVALIPGGGQAREALVAGARGLVLRSAPGARVAAALQAVAGGLFALDGPVGSSLLRTAPAGHAAEPLTPRELEVLALMAEGLANRAISERLGITERTAKFHASAILAKLGAASRSEAIVRAARLGLVAI
jgi:two-component system nitrate/nitrite response regulator NarL